MIDEELYQFASDELNSDRRNQELWNRACALARDDHDEARFLYKNLRVEELLELQANGEPLPFIPSSQSNDNTEADTAEPEPASGQESGTSLDFEPTETIKPYFAGEKSAGSKPGESDQKKASDHDADGSIDFDVFDAGTSDKGLGANEVVQSTNRGFTDSNSDSAEDLSEDFLLELDASALSKALEAEEEAAEEDPKPGATQPAMDLGKTPPSALPDGFSSASTSGSEGYSAIDPEISSLAAMASERIRKRAEQDAEDNAAEDEPATNAVDKPFEDVKPYTFEDEANAFEATLTADGSLPSDADEDSDSAPDAGPDDTQLPESGFLTSFPDADLTIESDQAESNQTEKAKFTTQDTSGQTLDNTELDLTGQVHTHHEPDASNSDDMAFLDNTLQPTQPVVYDDLDSVIPEKDSLTEDLERQADTWLPTDVPAADAIDNALPVLPATASQLKAPSAQTPVSTDYSAAGAGAIDAIKPGSGAELGPSSLRGEETASSLLDGRGAVFRVFRNSKDTRAVKDGLSWAAMFFTLPWLLVKRLPGTALMYLILWAVLATGLLITGIQWLDAPTAAAGNAALWPIGFAALAVVGTLLVPLFLANRWYAQALSNRGYREVAKVRAVNARGAVERLSSLSA